MQAQRVHQTFIEWLIGQSKAALDVRTTPGGNPARMDR
jgi:hypothetical protein